MYSPLIQKLIDLFSKFPTVGPRTAARFVFYLVKLPKDEFDNLINSLKNLKESTKNCFFCFNPFDATQTPNRQNLCPICSNNIRNKTLLCVVEKETDLASIEKTKKYNGLYFILGDTISILKKDDDIKTRMRELEERIKKPELFGLSGSDFKEIIIALNPTPEGETTALYLERLLKPLGIKTTRLGRGLPIGGELEYADEETLENAFEGRK